MVVKKYHDIQGIIHGSRINVRICKRHTSRRNGKFKRRVSTMVHRIPVSESPYNLIFYQSFLPNFKCKLPIIAAQFHRIKHIYELVKALSSYGYYIVIVSDLIHI